MAEATETLRTNNETWGFYGTVCNADQGFDVDAAWTTAFALIKLATNGSDEGVRDFLDSRLGRHLADEAVGRYHRGEMDLNRNPSLMPALVATVSKWNGWTIGNRDAKQHGIPKGLPYLTG